MATEYSPLAADVYSHASLEGSANQHAQDTADWRGSTSSASGVAGTAPDHDSKPSKKIYIVVGIFFTVLIAAGVMMCIMLIDTLTDPEARYAHLKNFCSHVGPISKAELSTRRARLAEEMAHADVDVFVAEAGSTLFYLTGAAWEQSERPFLVVLSRLDNSSADPRQHEYLVVSPAFEHDKAVEEVGPGVSLVYYQEDQSPYAVLTKHLGLDAGTGAHVVVDRDARGFVHFGLAGALAPGHTASSDNGGALVRQVRGIKSTAEVAIMRCANLATKAAIRAVLESVKGSTTQADVSARIATALEIAGLSNTWSIALFGPNAAAPHGIAGNAGLRLTKGMMILLDAGGQLHGYQSDITRTVVWPLGATTSADGPEHFARTTLVWETVRDAHIAALAAIRPGALASDVDAAARRVVQAAGFGGDYEAFTHRLGHGIGIDGHEDPYMNRGNAEEIQVGHCFSVEPGIYLKDEMGVRIEDIVCVTNSTAPYYELFGATSYLLQDPLKDH
ncbi:hypothetical protein H696_00911 [Fonticula alba]|uniref:Peptidase M24 domain-containing protein n=1 Tax=Fonticula alba TaxID=691883 RepID=A0A058ZIM6_FONAL|nr:hypothetical protein H696_00911 [Fonticula alba]KCV73372.1 hypothetical protein H696_00911 [Fonticula alba]|eukprot:XP_009493073.1 hypothetical protein H696_00911 [Fonticula alba]